LLPYQIDEVKKPLSVTETAGQFDAEVKVSGGGPSGQVDAVKL